MTTQTNSNQLKFTFINNEIWSLTFAGAFQRANIYSSKVSDNEKNEFKVGLRKFVEEELYAFYQKDTIHDDIHLEQIYKLSNYSKKYTSILQGEQLNFGVSQKIVNLFLKYQWCLGKIPPPPHFPVDRRIQEIIKYKPIVSWTKFKDETDYMKIICFVRKNLGDHSNIAQYELDHFERRLKTT